MNPLDNDLKDFFDEMRNADQKVDIPVFDTLMESKPKQKRYWIPLGIAASLAIIASTFLFYQQQYKQPESMELIISLGTPAESDTQQLIQYESSIDSWESPTHTLIEDF